MMPFGLKIAIINRAFRKKLDEKASALGLTSVQLRVLGSISRLEASGEAEIHQNDLEQIEQAVLNAESDGRPSVIICSTVKGKGISFMENVADWHGKAPDEKQFAVAREELYAAYMKAKEARENG